MSDVFRSRMVYGSFPQPATKREQVYGDLLFCYEYLGFAFKSPHFLDFGTGGVEINRVPTRPRKSEPRTFFIRWKDPHVSLEYLFSKYCFIYAPNGAGEAAAQEIQESVLGIIS